jgi:hypothetical protein
MWGGRPPANPLYLQGEPRIAVTQEQSGCWLQIRCKSSKRGGSDDRRPVL